jgi:hypothetical protein
VEQGITIPGDPINKASLFLYDSDIWPLKWLEMIVGTFYTDSIIIPKLAIPYICEYTQEAS